MALGLSCTPQGNGYDLSSNLRYNSILMELRLKIPILPTCRSCRLHHVILRDSERFGRLQPECEPVDSFVL